MLRLKQTPGPKYWVYGREQNRAQVNAVHRKQPRPSSLQAQPQQPSLGRPDPGKIISGILPEDLYSKTSLVIKSAAVAQDHRFDDLTKEAG